MGPYFLAIKKTIFSVGMIVLNVHSGICRRSGVASRSSTLAWKIPWMEEPGGLQSIGVAKSRTRQSDFTFTFHFHSLEKETATLSSVLAWRIPGTGSLVGCRLRARKTTWFPPLGKMRPLPATASQGKSPVPP